jgi:SAM-dependent methyltransferase
LAGFKPDLSVSDAENLTFSDNTFDVVYSYGVMHHSADVQRCLDEAWRVLKPGGQARIMLYHHPSMTGLMLWLRYGLFKGKSLRDIVFEKLESPGTKSFSKPEVSAMMAKFEYIAMRQVFSPGDLLLNQASARFQNPFYRAVWALFPRFLVRTLCPRLGLFLLVSARKPNTR